MLRSGQLSCVTVLFKAPSLPLAPMPAILKLNAVLGLLLTLTYVPFGPYLLFLIFSGIFFFPFLCLSCFVVFNISRNKEFVNTFFKNFWIYFLFTFICCKSHIFSDNYIQYYKQQSGNKAVHTVPLFPL